MNSSHQQNVAIAGGGLLGRLLAWRLTTDGHAVTLYESGGFSRSKSAAYTAAAMISPMSEVVVSDRSIYEMGIQSLALWSSWFENLPASFNDLFTRNGSVVVAHPLDAAELHQFVRDLQYHLGDKNNSQWLDAIALRELEPDLSPDFHQGLFLPDEGYLHNREFLDRLLDLLKALGVTLLENATISLADGIKLNGAPLPVYDLLFDCRGMGARESNNKVRGVRGETLWVETSEVTLNRPVRLLHPRYKLYVVPKPQNRFIIGATEIESEDRSPVSVQSTLELCSALYTLNPAFAEARIVEMDANLRPSLVDNLPAIEKTSVATAQGKSQTVISINGLYRHGYLLAPSLIEQALGIACIAPEKHFTLSAIN